MRTGSSGGYPCWAIWRERNTKTLETKVNLILSCYLLFGFILLIGQVWAWTLSLNEQRNRAKTIFRANRSPSADIVDCVKLDTSINHRQQWYAHWRISQPAWRISVTLHCLCVMRRGIVVPRVLLCFVKNFLIESTDGWGGEISTRLFKILNLTVPQFVCNVSLKLILSAWDYH